MATAKLFSKLNAPFCKRTAEICWPIGIKKPFLYRTASAHFKTITNVDLPPAKTQIELCKSTVAAGTTAAGLNCRCGNDPLR